MRVHMNGQLQYATSAEGTAAVAWFTGWVSRNGATLDPSESNTYSSHAITPDENPDVGVCVWEITFDFWLVGAFDYNAIMAEIQAAVYDGGVAQAMCYSSLDFSQES